MSSVVWAWGCMHSIKRLPKEYGHSLVVSWRYVLLALAFGVGFGLLERGVQKVADIPPAGLLFTACCCGTIGAAVCTLNLKGDLPVRQAMQGLFAGSIVASAFLLIVSISG